MKLGLPFRAGRAAALWLGALLAVTAVHAAGVEVRADAASEGAYGMRLNLGPDDCTAAQELVLDADDGPLQGDYQACRTISASAVAVTGAATTLRAGDRITLDTGFQVSAGAGLALEIDSSLNDGPTYVEDRTPIEENIYTARFSARLDGLALAAGERIGSLVAYSDSAESIFRLVIEPAAGGGYQLTLEARQDGGGMVQTPAGEELPVPAGWTVVEVEWSAGAGDGAFLVGIGGGALVGLTDLDNGAAVLEKIRWGGVDGDLYTAGGWLELDSFSSTR